MQKINGKPVFAATDLVAYLACGYRAELERAALAGVIAKPVRKDRTMDRIAKRGDQHEKRYLARLEEQGLTVVRIDKDGSAVAPLTGDAVPAPDAGDLLRAAQEATIAAMRAGADVVFQATFFDGRWRGHADFLLKREHEPGEPDSAFGPWHYEVADTKLARHVTAGAVLQICSYVDQLTRIQGRQPEYMHIVLGGREQPTDRRRVEDVMAYYRRVKAAFETSMGLGPVEVPEPVYPPRDLYPEPVDHCEVCRWAADCAKRRKADDDLSRVAGASARHRAALKARQVTTRTALASLELPVEPRIEGIGRDALARIREQARVQVESDGLPAPRAELLPLLRDENGEIVRDRGLLALPEPATGDLFLDLEGDPFALDDGVDYLFGVLEPGAQETDPKWLDGTLWSAAVPRFHAFWSLDASGRISNDAERVAFERMIDLVHGRWKADPSIHVYHYAAYEHTALGRIAQRYTTRELEVDELLRANVLVDLYRVVHQGLRVGVESYSIKRLEPLYGFVREQEMKDANSSIVAFEEWLELDPDQVAAAGAKILGDIEGYNRDDVLSTLHLRDWLEEQRAMLQRREGTILPRPQPPTEEETTNKGKAEDLAVAALAGRLTRDLPPDPDGLDDVGAGTRLLAGLLGWHRREEKAEFWRFIALGNMSEEDRLDEREPLAGLEPLGEPWTEDDDVLQRFTYPEQIFAVEAGDEVYDPDTRRQAGTVTGLDEAARIIVLRRSGGWGDVLPTTILVNENPRNQSLKASLFALGETVAEHGMLAPAVHGPSRALLLREAPPAPVKGPAGELKLPGETDLDAAIRLVTAIEGGVLPIQGPPGSGKTYTGAHMIVRLVGLGYRVGVTANSHKVIGNLLRKVAEISATEVAAGRQARPVAIGQKPKTKEKPTFEGAVALAQNPAVRKALDQGTVDVVGATAWTWSSGKVLEGGPAVDVLFVDEAGQMSLANTLAASPAARALVLLGDPQQLDQPTQGSHPPGAERSALAHILGDRPTIAADAGLFLEHTWRLHPDICTFTSAAFYAGELGTVDGLERQEVRVEAGHPLAGTGVRHIEVDHHGNATESPEEAAAIVDLVRSLLDAGATWVDMEGRERALRVDDVVIVAPYNAHVATIEQAFAAAGIDDAFVGTVDKFQGQERAISIYAMGTSAPEDAPRGMEFLFSLNRLNVATSRARCVTAIVGSPALLRVACRTPRQMQLANGLCLGVEAAERQAAERRQGRVSSAE